MNPLISAFALAAVLAPPAAAQSIPQPQLQLTATEAYSMAGGRFTRYRFDVTNKSEYPGALFAPAPALPPCGLNANSSRAWVDFFDAGGKRLYGFCALTPPAHLGSIWFALPEGTLPPSYVYIEIHDRQTGVKYRSNLAETSI